MRSSPRPLALLAALVAPLLLGLCAGCDSWSASTDTGHAAGKLESVSLLHLMVGATKKVEFQGVRRYEAYWNGGSGPQSLVYRETVSADGTGQFAIEPQELIQPALPPAQTAQFLLLQKVREGLSFRYRDFEIRDIDTFAANYTAIFTGQKVTVAGRQAERLMIQRRDPTDRRFVVDVDPDNGLVLRAREELSDGTLVALSEFESLDLSPDLSGVVFHQSVSGEQTLPPGSALTSQNLGFQPSTPRQVPAGWRLIEVAKLVDPIDDRPWAKLVYSDGVELCFFVVAAPGQPTFHVQPGPPPDAYHVRSLAIGPWTVLQGEIAGRDVVVMGKQDGQVLADLIRSAFP